ncbi:DUF3263 domain-containing protein [Micromonospora sp. NBC_01813]|uniref:DUF3263 domain-containing protein n=1 Tax=Micromonospora sp. NBC_01813 TaxID=2975988 RepID=UPI002DDC33CA|nr:DUF3263 domain-containing protein [Micromonospora sp. NBC_01813]WSA06581.1 DUF3263 domain-containing protein [Micromonospora sp. NBC_01813]
MPAADEPRTGPGPGAEPRASTGVPRQRFAADPPADSDDPAGASASADVDGQVDVDPPADGDSARPAVEPAGATLTEREQRILDFERQWWKHAGAKEQSVRDTFGLSATRYYQLLNQLLDNPAALAAEPVLVARLRRLRATRSRARRR